MMPQEETHHVWVSPAGMDNIGIYGQTSAPDKTGRLWNVIAPKGIGFEPPPTPEGSPCPMTVDEWNTLLKTSETMVYIKNPPDLPIVIYLTINPINMEKKE